MLTMDPVPAQTGGGASTKVWATFKVPMGEIDSFTVFNLELQPARVYVHGGRPLTGERPP